jgi:hypothetical protein
MGDVERCHKVTARTRTKASSKSWIQQQRYIVAVSESNKRSKAHLPNVMQAFRSRLCKLTKPREERESAGKAIAEARCVGGDSSSVSEDDEHAELNSLLVQCWTKFFDELGYEFESSDEEL